MAVLRAQGAKLRGLHHLLEQVLHQPHLQSGGTSSTAHVTYVHLESGVFDQATHSYRSLAMPAEGELETFNQGSCLTAACGQPHALLRERNIATSQC